MLTASRHPAAKRVKLLPAGVRTTRIRLDRLPDGWDIVAAPTRVRVTTALDRYFLLVADSAARGVGRREFLRRLGRWTVGGATILSGIASGTRSATAHGQPCDYFEDPGESPCGPSAICAAKYCRDDGKCKTAVMGVRKRGDASIDHWFGNACVSDGADTCWLEHCCDQTGHHVNCCDCCVPENPNDCNVCDTKNKCICRAASAC